LLVGEAILGREPEGNKAAARRAEARMARPAPQARRARRALDGASPRLRAGRYGTRPEGRGGAAPQAG